MALGLEQGVPQSHAICNHIIYSLLFFFPSAELNMLYSLLNREQHAEK